MMFKPLSPSTLRPSSALLPSRRTTTGTDTPTSDTAPMMPSAIMSQRTMPPKMLISTAFTLVSERMILNASVTRSLVAPPPTSRKVREHGLGWLGHALPGGGGANVRAVGGGGAVPLPAVPAGPGQAGAVDHGADIASQSHIGESPLAGPRLGGIVLARVMPLTQLWL